MSVGCKITAVQMWVTKTPYLTLERRAYPLFWAQRLWQRMVCLWNWISIGLRTLVISTSGHVCNHINSHHLKLSIKICHSGARWPLHCRRGFHVANGRVKNLHDLSIWLGSFVRAFAILAAIFWILETERQSTTRKPSWRKGKRATAVRVYEDPSEEIYSKFAIVG